MDSVLTLLNEYRILVGAVLTVLVTSYLVFKMWDKVAFGWLRVMCHIPVFGKIARLSKNHSYDPDKGWFSSEREICAEFQPYYDKSDKTSVFFEQCSSYLRKVQETGRKKLSLFGWILLAVMVFIEAMGFSYVLAGWTIPGASEALKEQGAFGIAILISGLLVFMTHHTGHELHANNLIKKVRAWFNQSQDQSYKMIPNTKVSLDRENIDDGEPEWRQLLSRLMHVNHNVTPSYVITIATVILVVTVAVGSTYVRGQTLESMMAEEMLNPAETNYSDVDYLSEDPYATNQELPVELTEIQEQVDSQAKGAKEDADRKGAWTTFIILAFIFIFLQFMGVLIGYKTGFAGKESADARSYRGKFKTGEEFERFHERKRDLIAQQAQKCLEKLQGRMVNNAQNTNIDRGAIEKLRNTKGRSFYAYVSDLKGDKLSHEPEKIDASVRSDVEFKHSSNETDKPSSFNISEQEISTWMKKLGWNREKTLELLEKHYASQKQKHEAVSEKEALEMLKTQEPIQVSEEEAMQLLSDSTGEKTA